MGLQQYAKKRIFQKTPEPSGKSKEPASNLIFVVQRHKASHLHYDLRLEMDGVLKSWAVPKGPSMNPQDKRLAMMVEDHPYDYKDFEGIIPEGNYGAGMVEIWDRGFVSDPENSPGKTAEKKLKDGLKKGNLKFLLHGKKLKGEFVLVKIKGEEVNARRAGNGKQAWLLIKHRDKYAVKEPYNSEEHTPQNSPINKWLKERKKTSVKKRSRYDPVTAGKVSNYIKPMLARDTDKAFDNKDWIFEIKWDGYRAIAEIDNGDVKLYSRNGNSFNNVYYPIVSELEKIKAKAVLDGEIVVLGEDGKPSFQLLQDYRNGAWPIQYHVFDILMLNGKNICDLELLERKKLLKQLLKKNDIINYSDHIPEKGIDFFRAALENDLEGIIAKKAASEYYPGTRTSEWLKIKHHKTREVIITGFTEPTGSRKYFGALVLGVLDNGSLRYAGHTGSGFNDQSLKDMYARLEPLIIGESPFDEAVKTNMPVTWVKPVLVCEVKYTELTRDGRMRHPIFLHLRPDKNSKEVTLKSMKTLAKPVAGKESKQDDKTYTFGKIKVKTTHHSKIFWLEEGITKGDVIEYYLTIADYILPYLKNRPESLKRNPNGILDKGFYHKDVGGEAPTWIKSVKIFSESANKDIDYIICNNTATLVYMNNLGCIEINPWHSTVKALDNPDYLVIDIDPSDKNTFEEVIETANVIHGILEKVKAENFCKTSGATGMHVYVPVGGKYTYDQIKDFARIICMLTNEQLPRFTTLERSLKKRGDKIYLDHLQNRRGQTIACAYSLRPHPGATVSMPLHWKEVKSGLLPSAFDIHTAPKRLKKTGDIFSGIFGKGINIRKCLKELGQ